MSEWAWVSARSVTTQRKDIIQLVDGLEYRTMGVRWYGKGAYDRGIGTTETIKATRLYRATAGDFVFNRIDTQNGAFDVVPENLDGALVTNEFPLYTTDPDRLLARFLLLFFQQGSVLRAIGNSRAGSEGRARWKEADFETHLIPLPSIAEQWRIVEVIDAIDSQTRALTEELKRTVPLRHRLFLDSDDMTSVAIEDVATVSQGKALPKPAQGQQSGEISWFKIADMTGPENEDGYTVADTRLTYAQIALLKGVIVPAGSVVFPRVGAAVLTEKKRLLDVDGAVDENHLVLTPKQGVSPECLLAAIESIRLAELVQTGAVPSLNMGLIRSARIPWSDNTSDALGAALRCMRANTRNLRSELGRLKSLRSTVLTALMSQEIEIPESYDDLLEEVS